MTFASLHKSTAKEVGGIAVIPNPLWNNPQNKGLWQIVLGVKGVIRGTIEAGLAVFTNSPAPLPNPSRRFMNEHFS